MNASPAGYSMVEEAIDTLYSAGQRRRQLAFGV